MKRLLFILSLFFVFISCSSDEEPNFYNVIVPVTEYEIPQEFVLGETYPIKVWFKKPTSCHNFSGFYFDKNLNKRTIAVQNMVSEEGVCVPSGETMVASFNFYVTSNGSYIFKFWKGANENGVDVYDEIEVPVVD